MQHEEAAARYNEAASFMSECCRYVREDPIEQLADMFDNHAARTRLARHRFLHGHHHK